MHISEIWRFPVKSMSGETLETAIISERGILGDRSYALIDTETGKVGSAKSTKKFARILECKARFLEEPELGATMPPVRVELPDGRVTTSDADDIDSLLSDFFGHAVTLAQVPPKEFIIDQTIPDVEDADPMGLPGAVKQSPLGHTLFKELGMDLPIPEGLFFDVFPLTVITDATLAQMETLSEHTRADPRRFRMNFLIETGEQGFVENGWIGQSLALDGGVKMVVTMPDPRCVVTTLPQGVLPQDIDVIRTLVAHNRLDLEGRQYPCAGVYAMPVAGGALKQGEKVTLA